MHAMHATTTTLSLRSLERAAVYHYHRYRSAEEAMHTEMCSIIAGDRVGIRTLERLQRQRDQAWRELLPYLQEIARRIRHADGLLPHQDDDQSVVQYFRERQQRRERAAEKEKGILS